MQNPQNRGFPVSNELAAGQGEVGRQTPDDLNRVTQPWIILSWLSLCDSKESISRGIHSQAPHIDRLGVAEAEDSEFQ